MQIRLRKKIYIYTIQNYMLKKMIEWRSYGCLQVAVLVTKTPSLSDVIKLHLQLFNFTYLNVISFQISKENKKSCS